MLSREASFREVKILKNKIMFYATRKNLFRFGILNHSF